MFNKIVVGIDGSESAENALRLACNIAQKFNSKIYLVHAPQTETVAYAVGSGMVMIPPTQKELDAAGEKVIERGKKIASEYDQTIENVQIQTGSAAALILDSARNFNADLIVTGRRGLGGVASFILGSTSLHVTRNAYCACLSVI